MFLSHSLTSSFLLLLPFNYSHSTPYTLHLLFLYTPFYIIIYISFITIYINLLTYSPFLLLSYLPADTTVPCCSGRQLLF